MCGDDVASSVQRHSSLPHLVLLQRRGHRWPCARRRSLRYLQGQCRVLRERPPAELHACSRHPLDLMVEAPEVTLRKGRSFLVGPYGAGSSTASECQPGAHVVAAGPRRQLRRRDTLAMDAEYQPVAAGRVPLQGPDGQEAVAKRQGFRQVRWAAASLCLSPAHRRRRQQVRHASQHRRGEGNCNNAGKRGPARSNRPR